MALQDYGMLGGPDMRRDSFIGVLSQVFSPAASEAGTMYDALVEEGVKPAPFLGFFRVESQYATDQNAVVVKFNTKNPGNVRSPQDPALATGIDDTPRGKFAHYATWTNGTRDWARRIKGEKYAGVGLDTVRKVLPKYAPSADSNNPNAYGDSVLAFVAAHIEDVPVVPHTPTGGNMAEPEIIDLRGRLPVNQNGGGAGTKFAAKRGQVLHYSAVNYSRDRDAVDILISEANFHIGTYLKEHTIAYHFSVDPYTGVVYQLRDEDDVVWHCGYWGTPGNQDGLAIHVPGGDALVMEPVAVQNLLWLFQRNERKYGFGRAALKGHKEVSSTSCPGPLMGQVVNPYRAGTLNYAGGGAVDTGNAATTKDPVTGHTVHPELMDIYKFELHGRPLLPAVGYSDGGIRQLFERACLGVGMNGKPDTIEGLGQALMFMAGGDTGHPRYPEWPDVKPLV